MRQGQKADLWGFPDSIAADGAGNVYVTSTRVFKSNAHGRLQDVFGDPGAVTGICDITVGAIDSIYAIENKSVVVNRLDSNGNLLGSWGGPGSDQGKFSSPRGIAAATR